jgi:hypothetical protein
MLEVKEGKSLLAENLCMECAATSPKEAHLKTLLPDGDAVWTRNLDGVEIVRCYKCSQCGALWENLIERGAGGHGNFWKRIDPPR